jgi:fructokinase
VRIGVDLGGTKIEIVALDERGATLLRRRVPTPAGSYEAILDAVARLVAGVEAETGRRGSVGVGHPGVSSPRTGLIKNANSTILIGKPLERDLSSRLGRPLRLANDADCFALSEAADGAGAGARCVFGVILGTGAGGGIVLDGRLWTGRNGIAGEWGHNPLPWPEPGEFPGPPCYCGRHGCLETFLSGAGLARDYLDATGRTRDAREIAAAAAEGEAAAGAALARYTRRLAKGLSGVVNVLDPDVVVLGGGLSNITGLATAVAAELPAYVFSDAVDTRLAAAFHGDSSGVRGAARLWPATAPE